MFLVDLEQRRRIAIVIFVSGIGKKYKICNRSISKCVVKNTATNKQIHELALSWKVQPNEMGKHAFLETKATVL